MTKKRITEMNVDRDMETFYVLMQMIETRLGYSMITPYSGG